MKFVIENISKSSGRLGHWVHSETNSQLQTPLLLQTTKCGSVPYLSREVFDYVSKDVHILQLSLATMSQMVESLKLFKGGLGAYIGYASYPTLLMVRDPCEVAPSKLNDRDVVPLFTRHGKEGLTVQKYMDVVEVFGPDIYQGLCDADTNAESSKKRVQKSVDRTEQFMDHCYERHTASEELQKATLFVPIVGGYNKFARSQSIKHAMTRGSTICGGFLFEGFHSYGLSATEVSLSELLPILEHCVSQLEASKPRMMPGAYTPLLMLELVRLGVDMFDMSYAYCATANFKAVSFHYDLNTARSPNVPSPFVDVTDDSIKEDFTPLFNGCDCLACRQHTRAYIYHLYNTKELLGTILLMIHNLHHFMRFFEAIRASVAADNLSDLIALIKYQCTDKEIDYRIHQNTKEISKASFDNGFQNADAC